MIPLFGIGLLAIALAGFVLLKLAFTTRLGEIPGGGSYRTRDYIGYTLKQKLSLVWKALWGGPAARQIDLEEFQFSEIETSLTRKNRKRGRYPKRLLDIAASLIMLLVLAPMLLLVAIAVKIDSPGPVFYRQRRVGINGKIFEVIKFRSMVSDAEKNGARWADKNDSRITKLGRLLRNTRIDEIPQAINVLRGEMSFVGPRPERPAFIEVLEKEIPHYNDRHVVKPGITGWAQVEYEYGASVDDARKKLTYDLFYIKNFSIAFDFIILMKTVRVTLFGIGSR